MHLKYYVDIIRRYPDYGPVQSRGKIGFDTLAEAKYLIFQLQGIAYDMMTGTNLRSQDFTIPYLVLGKEIVNERSFRIMRRK